MAIVKKNVCNESAPVTAWQRPMHFPGEASFVGRPGATEEDDGVLVAATHDGDAGEEYLLVLNASTMASIAELRLPTDVAPRRLLAFGIHGLFSPGRV